MTHELNEQPKKPRIRKRSIAMQLQIALKDAELAATSKETDEYTIARMRLLQTRLKILSVKESREKFDQTRKLKAEVERLRGENERLRADMEGKGAPRPMNDIERVLSQYEMEKQRGSDGNRL